MSFTNEDLAQGLSFTVEAGKNKKYPRHYLGLSQLGHSCARNLWFYFRWASKVEYSWRTMRIFSAGNDSEAIIVESLRRAGFIVEGTQIELSHRNGFLLGHIDGIVSNLPEIEKEKVLLEAKSMKAAKWKSCVANGVKKTYKTYYCQSQAYMQKLELTKTLFVFLNKDTSELHYEFIDYNEDDATSLILRGEDIVDSPVPVKGLSTDPEYFECNWCEFKSVCHKNEPFEITCRTCKYVELNEGNFYCSITKECRTIAQQKEACLKYEMLEV